MHPSRREFLKSTVAATALTALGGTALADVTKRTATDWVPLGQSGVRVTRLAFGTGTHGGRVQRELGQAEFTRQVRYAYDHGIRFFETADTYYGMPEMLAIALKGLPRDSYRLMTKHNVENGQTPQESLDSMRMNLNTEYLDIVLMHCMRSPTWPTDEKRVEDAFSEAKEKKIILAKGASVHGLPALREFPGNQWLDLAMIRMNHNGTRMDTEDTRDTAELGNVPEVVKHVKQVRADGKGVISMKLVGEGRFTRREDRQAALHFAFNVAGVNAVTIGYKSTAEIDEAIENLNLALAA